MIKRLGLVAVLGVCTLFLLTLSYIPTKSTPRVFAFSNIWLSEPDSNFNLSLLGCCTAAMIHDGFADYAHQGAAMTNGTKQFFIWTASNTYNIEQVVIKQGEWSSPNCVRSIIDDVLIEGSNAAFNTGWSTIGTYSISVCDAAAPGVMTANFGSIQSYKGFRFTGTTLDGAGGAGWKVHEVEGYGYLGATHTPTPTPVLTNTPTDTPTITNTPTETFTPTNTKTTTPTNTQQH